MKRAKLHIVVAQILLLCFVAGQFLIYAHQHHAKAHVVEVQKKPFTSVVKERCDLCDAMHHTVMLPGTTPHLPSLFSSAYRHFVANEFHFTPIGLILASGRAPPVV
ncbi:hypothetical protein [Mucilaginibacter sp.]